MENFSPAVAAATPESEYLNYIADLIAHPAIREMKNYSQHSKCNRLKHSLYVSYNSFLICRKFGLDAESAARGGLLHDFFLYDKCDNDAPKGFHGLIHPRVALKNASEMFELNKIERDIIKRHMFPLTITPPRYRESFIVMCVDKYCACMEALDLIKRAKVIPIWNYLPA